MESITYVPSTSANVPTTNYQEIRMQSNDLYQQELKIYF